MRKLGVDTGGTFTDFVYVDGSELIVHKILSTPQAPERAILQGIREMGLVLDGLEIVHGSTVATNALLERKGVRTAYITNRGFADVLTIGRQARRSLYQLQPQPVAPPVPVKLCLETGGRLAADGSVVEPLTAEDLNKLRQSLQALKPDAVAINLLFSFLDDRFERLIEEIVPASIYVSRSSTVLREYREYERGIVTWLNAYIGPLMQRYLSDFAGAVEPAEVAVMQSHGGTVNAEEAGDQAAQLLLSGPAGGLVGAKYQAALSHCEKLMTFDMGGTSTDVALIDGDIALTSESEIAGYPVATPMVDLHTIGAGGGSIAWLDDGGMLQVGPQSAGADPGPACYGKGGQQPTVTDANLLLGNLPHSTSLGGYLKLDLATAQAAMTSLASKAGLSMLQLAEGIVTIANEHMAQALRVISVQRGHNPQEFTLLSFGGAGGLHVCALAELLGMKRSIVPAHGGVLSALGMVVSQPGRELSASSIKILEEIDASGLEKAFCQMEKQLTGEMAEPASQLRFTRRLDLRYHGQSSTLPVLWQPSSVEIEQAFHQAHQNLFGHQLDIKVEMVNLRVRATTENAATKLPLLSSAPISTEPNCWNEPAGSDGNVPVYQRRKLPLNQSITGPAVITEPVATTFIASGWVAQSQANGNLTLIRQ